VALSDNGNTLAVGALSAASAATGVNGDQADNNAPEAGVVYVLVSPNRAMRFLNLHDQSA
jgi:hypothetical protein